MRQFPYGDSDLQSDFSAVSKKNWFVTLFLVLMATSAFGELPSPFKIPAADQRIFSHRLQYARRLPRRYDLPSSPLLTAYCGFAVRYEMFADLARLKVRLRLVSWRHDVYPSARRASRLQSMSRRLRRT